MKTKEPIWLTVTRILLAAVFLFSGFSKAIDPIGFSFTMDDYFTSFGMAFLHPISMFCTVVAIILEFTLGFMMLFRIKVKLASLGYLLFMVFFFFLTLWMAIAEHLEINYGYNFGVVKDCGCFGSVIKMSNLETFLKNVVIMIPTVIIFIKRKQIPDIRLTELGKWCFACLGGLIIVGVQIYCYRHLPMYDTSDWKKGDDLVPAFIGQPAEKEMLFIYKNSQNQELMNLTADEMGTIADQIPDFYETYEYVDRIDSIIVEAIDPDIAGFNMLDANGKDHSTELINRDNQTPLFLLVMFDLSEVNGKAFDNSNLKDIIQKAAQNNQNFVGITNSSHQEIEQFIAKHNIEFPIYMNPIDPVKGPFMVRDAIRSNPGLILIERGFVKGKWSWRDIPPYMITD